MVDKIVRIKLEGGSAISDANRTNRAVKGVGASADRASSSLFNMSKVATAVITSLATTKIIRYADAWTNVNNRIRAATKTSLEFRVAQESIIATAQRAGVDISAVADAYSRISQATSELGINQERVTDVVSKLTLALKAGGATGAETSSVMIQLAQGLGSGALQGDELRSILEASIPITKALSKEFGVTTGELKKLGSEGKLTADRVVEAIENIDEKSLTFTKDITSGFTEVNNALTVYIGRLDESLGASENVAAVLSGLANNIDEVVEITSTFIQLGAALYITNITKALIANTGAFIANQAQIVRYNAALAAGSGVSRVAAASTWALTYAMRALKAALPFGAIFLGLEVLQSMLTATNDQIEANDRYAESTRKLNARLDTRAEKERAIALRTAAEVNARNQDKLLRKQQEVEEQRLKLERSNAAELARIRGEEYEEADKLSLFQITKVRNRIALAEDEAKRLEAIASRSQAAFEKIQGSVGGKASKSQVTDGAFVDPSQAAGASETRQTNRGLDSFFAQDGVFSGGGDISSGGDSSGGEDLTAKLERENQMIQQSLLSRKSIYSEFYEAANDLSTSDRDRAMNQLAFDIEMQKQAEQQAFTERLQAITDRQLSISENKNLNDEQKKEAEALLREQAVLAEQEFQNRITEITAEGNVKRENLELASFNARVSAWASFGTSTLSLISSFGSQSEKTQKKFAIAESIINITAGVAKALNNPYPANLGFAAQVAAQGAALVSTIRGTSSGSSATPKITASPSFASSTSSATTASSKQNTKRIVDLRGFGDGGFLTKEQLTALLEGDEDVILANNNGQAQGSRVGLI